MSVTDRKSHPGRSGVAWRRARQRVLSESEVCAICGLPIDPEAPPKSRWSASVDHVIPLAAMRDLDPSEQRALALDPELLRVAHVSCNSKRGAGRRVERRVSRSASEW